MSSTDQAARTAASAKLFADACAVIPGGVNSPVRAFSSVGGTPAFITSANGYWLTDADGNRYVDLTAAFGVANVGHAHPDVVHAVAHQAETLLHGMGDVHPARVKVELLEKLAAIQFEKPLSNAWSRRGWRGPNGSSPMTRGLLRTATRQRGRLVAKSRSGNPAVDHSGSIGRDPDELGDAEMAIIVEGRAKRRQ